MDKRQDRKIEIEHELQSMNLFTKCERFVGIETQTCGIIGCTKSHLEVLKIAKQRNYKNVLILEDDFMFLVSKEILEDELQCFFTSIEQSSFDICMLSYNLIHGEPISNNTKLIKAMEVQTASGYIVNASFYDALIILYEENIPLLENTQMHWLYANDQCWKKLQPQSNWYCFQRRLGKQRAGFSDNSKEIMDFGC